VKSVVSGWDTSTDTKSTSATDRFSMNRTNCLSMRTEDLLAPSFPDPDDGGNKAAESISYHLCRHYALPISFL
jgi:hypothetical protein